MLEMSIVIHSFIQSLIILKAQYVRRVVYPKYQIPKMLDNDYSKYRALSMLTFNDSFIHASIMLKAKYSKVPSIGY